MNRIIIHIEWNSLEVTGYLTLPGQEGDPSIPNGIRTLPPYVDEIEVLTPNGEEITEYLTDEAQVQISNNLLETYYRRSI